ncbi:MAG: hypothetical protein IZT59_12985, partial [Verrucomicrobia bacterium]|nr:hypothetical protein [Verrucomicrobiota bacterium]
MRKPKPLFFAALAGLASTFLFFATAAQEQEEPRKSKVVFIAGKASHGRGAHEHRAGSMLLADHLTKSGAGFETTVVTNGWPEDESILDGADAIVIYADGGGGHPAM